MGETLPLEAVLIDVVRGLSALRITQAIAAAVAGHDAPQNLEDLEAMRADVHENLMRVISDLRKVAAPSETLSKIAVQLDRAFTHDGLRRERVLLGVFEADLAAFCVGADAKVARAAQRLRQSFLGLYATAPAGRI
jgi:hypothetical protein